MQSQYEAGASESVFGRLTMLPDMTALEWYGNDFGVVDRVVLRVFKWEAADCHQTGKDSDLV